MMLVVLLADTHHRFSVAVKEAIYSWPCEIPNLKHMHGCPGLQASLDFHALQTVYHMCMQHGHE